MKLPGNDKKLIIATGDYLPPAQSGLPQRVNGKIRAVRKMIRKDANGVCRVVAELVDYVARPNVPASSQTKKKQAQTLMAHINPRKMRINPAL